MRRSEAKAAVFQAAPDGILLVDDKGTIREANDQALTIFGYQRGELEGRSVEDLVPEARREAHRNQREGYTRSPHARPMGIEMELAGLRKDGSEVPVEISLSPLPSQEELLVIAIVRDLTKRRRLRNFGAGTLRATEEERRRIARELHDETAQDLAALLLRLTLLERRLDTRDAGEVAELRAALHETVDGVRRIARGLRPPELEDVGLGAALRSYVRERYPNGGIEMTFDGSEERLGTEQSLAAYRIAQEALANAARHSGARTVQLTIQACSATGETGGGHGTSSDHVENGDTGRGGRPHSRGSQAVELRILDDGCGFDPGRMRHADAGLGLMGMEERAQLVGGTFELSTRRGKGTQVRVRLPTEVASSASPSSGRKA